MKLHLPNCIQMAGLYKDLWRLPENETFQHLLGLHQLVTTIGLGCYPAIRERLDVAWLVEERLPVELRRLYYRELYGPASRFDESNGNCLGSDAYEWTLIHPTATERARALCATYLIAMIKQLYDEGVDHPILDHLRDRFSDQASEAGCTYEVDHDQETWNEKHFDALFAPLEEGYKP